MMDELFAAVRETASARTWSAGVELSRNQAVVVDSHRDDEIECSVRARTGPRRFQVHLYVEDEDWSCTCSSSEDVCEHVAAAVITLRQASKRGQQPNRPADAVRIRYHFLSDGDRLRLERELVNGANQREPLKRTLEAESRERDVLSRDVDFRIEAALGSRAREVLPRDMLMRVLSELVDEVVHLDGHEVTAGRPHPGMNAVVEECPAGFRVRLEQTAGVKRIYANGALAIGGVLHPLRDSGLDARSRTDYQRGVIVDRERRGDLVSRLIPELERSVPVDVRTDLLPKARRMRPRIAIETRQTERSVEAMATLVYGDPPIARVDGDSLRSLRPGAAPIRDLKAEQTLQTQLGAELQLAFGQRVALSASEAIELGSRLATASLPTIAQHESLIDHGPLAASLTDAAHFQPSFRIGKKSANPQAVIEAWMAGEDHVPLLEGGFGRLPHDWLDRHGHRLSDLLAARNADGSLPRSLAATALPLYEELGSPPPPDLNSILSALEREASLPEDLTATLRDYQRDGVQWLLNLRDAQLGGMLADDMGLGKTLQAIAAIQAPALVVAPTSVIHNWRSEFEKFRPGLRVQIFHGRERTMGDADVTLTTYALLRRDIERLAARRWASVVLDEAQAIKNPDSQAARAAFKLDAPFRITLSGTPVENRLEELWSQMHFANPGLLGSKSSFEERYAKPMGAGDHDAATRLRSRLRPFLRRRLKRDVAPELPSRTDLVIRCELSESERALYDTIRAATMDAVVKQLGTGANPLAALEALLRLRQAACHPALLPDQAATSSSKLDALLDALEQALVDGHKALVFSQWTSLLDLVQQRLDAEGRSYVRLDGSSRDRGQLVETFQSPDGPELMLISLKAGGTGLNLTAADHVFLLDPWWNPAVEDQAADRAHRIGQERPVFVHRLVARDTVEEKILDLQERKRALADAAVGDAFLSQPLSRDELLELLH